MTKNVVIDILMYIFLFKLCFSLKAVAVNLTAVCLFGSDAHEQYWQLGSAMVSPEKAKQQYYGEPTMEI